MKTLDETLKHNYGDLTEPIDDTHWHSGREWVAPCMCGHHDHGYSGHREDMCCTESDNCDCGGFDPQPGCYRPRIRHEGAHPFLSLLRVGR